MAVAIALPVRQTLNRSVESLPPDTSPAFARRDRQHLIWPATGQISQTFHRYHEGLDIAGPAGTPILAASSGTVTVAGWDDWGLGNAIVVQHENGSRTVYGHNQRLFVRVGQSVFQGQTIAEMGSTGNSTGPHLHFEVRPNGRDSVDPLSFLPYPAARPTYAPDHRGNAIAPAKGCGDRLLFNLETRNFRIQICWSEGQMFYFSQRKRYPLASLWLPARAIAGGFAAQNGSYTYRIRGDRLEVLQKGLVLRSERFLTP
ncbi:MAG: M23 family metallopeptidase [Cyanobacteria bacterium SBLK]|nr:M23 family metallopeptidase [Cyanobacteria bacterium SBLK]